MVVISKFLKHYTDQIDCFSLQYRTKFQIARWPGTGICCINQICRSQLNQIRAQERKTAVKALHQGIVLRSS